MKKLAIVSSFDELCGNAVYTKALLQEFSKHYDAEAIKLDILLLKKKSADEVGDAHIRDIAKTLTKFDYVNIQFEAGLFGSDPEKIFQRFKTVANASKNLIVTLHRCDFKKSFITDTLIQACCHFRLLSALRNLRSTRANNRYAQLYANIIRYCKEKNCSIIVHTERDKKLIQDTYKISKIYDHPLTFLTQEDINCHKQLLSREKFLKKYHLEKDDIIIGIFGFISPHKDYKTAIQALNYLPENYKLLIFGAQHPLSIKPHEAIEKHLSSILSYIEANVRKKKNSTTTLANRIKFCGGLDDDDFVRALLCCDFTVLPYLEVNQGGSGVASLVLDAQVPSIFSQTLAFIELEKYAKKAFKMFSIGNYMELATALQCYAPEEFSPGLKNYLQKYNMQTNIALHTKIFQDQEK